MRKEEKPVLFLFSLMQRYAFCAVLPKRAKLCRRLSKRRGAGRVGLTDTIRVLLYLIPV